MSYSRRALVQLEEIFTYIAKDNRSAAVAVVERIAHVAALLGQYPDIGRATDKEDVRVISVPRTPYVIFYKILMEHDDVRILRVRHPARRPLPRQR